MRQPLPRAARQAVGTLQTRDPRFDTGAEVAQLSIHPAALDHVLDDQAPLLVKRDLLHTTCLGRTQVLDAGIAAIARHLPRHCALASAM